PPLPFLLPFFPLPRPPSSPLFPYTTLFRSPFPPPSPSSSSPPSFSPLSPSPSPASSLSSLNFRREINSIEKASHNFFFAKENARSEEHTSELQSRENLVCRLLLEKKKQPKKGRVRGGAATDRRAGGPARLTRGGRARCRGRPRSATSAEGCVRCAQWSQTPRRRPR